MASIKVKFRPSTVAGCEGTIYYQVIHQRKVRQLISDYHVSPEEWDESRATVLTPAGSERQKALVEIRLAVRSDVERLTRIDRNLDSKGIDYTADDIVEEFRRYSQEYTVFSFMRRIITKLKEADRVRTAETYRSALNSFQLFRNGKDLMLDGVTPEIMEDYEGWLRKRGVVANTVSFYTRILRAVYNRAVEKEITDDRRPFRHVYTGIDKTVKRALPITFIRKIKRLKLDRNPQADYARDIFLLSFLLRGMSFIDMAFLRKTDLRNGHLIYRRRKTGQLLSIAWTGEMQDILDKYPKNESNYLLPIICSDKINARCAYRNKAYTINRALKAVGRMIGVTHPLTLYVARHSWASAAKVKGIPLAVISEGMGHDSETTTQIYLAELDTSLVDKANSVIISAIS